MSTAAAAGPAGFSERSLNTSLRVIRLGPALILAVLLVIMALASPFFSPATTCPTSPSRSRRSRAWRSGSCS
jgi:hypothetical protein